jgi:predicted membrane-bound spermidine synthase
MGMSTQKPTPGILALVFTNAFVIGFVVMAFEMVASRYMYPFFGGGINTWAALISTVLLALMTGYFVGGSLADRWHTSAFMGSIITVAAFYIALVPALSHDVFTFIDSTIATDGVAVLLSSMLILFVPIALFGTFTPYSIRLVLRSASESGKVSGRIYSVSTLGNVVGTLVTTFYLIPTIGSVGLTFIFAAVTFASGLSFWIYDLLHRPE